MTVAIVLLNVVFSVLVLAGMITLHGWAIATDLGRRQGARARIASAPRTAWSPRQAGLATH